MKTALKFTITTAIASSLLAISGCAEAGPGRDMKKADVEKIIQEYLMENPEIIQDALIELDRRNTIKDQEDAIKALADASDALRNDPRDVVIGPKDAKVTIVEFFDYNCGFCKRSTDWVKTVMEEHPNDVKIIFKESPVLQGRAKTSRFAAKAALAAARQGKYTTVHFSLMEERSLTEDRIRAIVKKTGLDMKKFDADMKDPAIEQHVSDTLALARSLPPMTGTPFFMVNDSFVSGADVDRLQALLDEELDG